MITIGQRYYNRCGSKNIYRLKGSTIWNCGKYEYESFHQSQPKAQPRKSRTEVEVDVPSFSPYGERCSYLDI